MTNTKIYRSISLLLAIISLLSLCSCRNREKPSCRTLLSALTESEIALPAGKTYSLSASEGEAEYLSPSLLASIYGNGEPPALLDSWLDCAIFLPRSEHPCEFAVFLCDSHNSATDTAKLLCRRLDLIRSAKDSDEYRAMLDSATVTVNGNFVIFIVSSDTKSALSAVRSAMK